MKKNDIIEELNKLDINKESFWVVGSSSLVLRDIIEDANDIDIAITSDYFDYVNEKFGAIYLGENHNNKWYRLNGIIEFCVDEKTSDKVDDMEPFNLLSLEYYYNNFIKDSNREKDIVKKEKIKKILKID